MTVGKACSAKKKKGKIMIVFLLLLLKVICPQTDPESPALCPAGIQNVLTVMDDTCVVGTLRAAKLRLFFNINAYYHG